MDNELEDILKIVQGKGISPEEGLRRVRRARSRRTSVTLNIDSLPTKPSNGTSAAAPATDTRRKVAVIGIACRFAGASSRHEFWQNLAAGRCSVREVPLERWDAERYYDPDPRAPGKTNSRWGGLLDDVDAFDPLFFNISGKEAELTDPQQRLFLEACWSALEDGGYATDAISGSSCGVFAGAPASDYATVIERAGLANDAQALMGNDTAILPARISYVLNLKGPSLAINTACSSSLVAVHLAGQAIESGQCEMALAGGVCLFITPSFYVSAAKAGMLSADGLCKTFDRDANGFVPGEGVGVLVLKELGAAVRDGDHIYGVILGSDTNQDGKTNGITAPSSLSQSAVQTSAYRRAGISPESLSLIEAHGTGTSLGDPIEVDALTRSFGQHTGRKQFCAIGSVKTNIGHTGQAAGVAGIIKVLLALQHELIPPTLHFRTLNDRIALSETPFFLATSPTPWPRRAGAPRRAAVSSFGYSGTNAHVVIEEPPEPEPGRAGRERDEHLILISGKTEEALSQRLADLEVWIEQEGRDCTLADIAYTLHAGRKHFVERAAFLVRDIDGMRAALRSARGARPEVTRLNVSEKREWTERIRRRLSETDLVDDSAGETIRELADLYVRGLDIDVDLLYPGRKGRRIPMPIYPFARERYWVHGDGDATAGDTADARQHPLLLQDISTPDEYRFAFRPAGHEFFVADHIVGGRGVLAAAVCMEMARLAGTIAGRGEVTRVRDITWRRPLPSDAPEGLEIRLAREGEGFRFEIDVAGRTSHAASAAGVVAYGGNTSDDVVDLPALRGRCAGSLSAVECYERFRKIGFEYGPGFRVIRELHYGDREVLARIELSDALVAASAGFVLHPALLDGALQAMIGLQGGDAAGSRLPYALAELDICTPLQGSGYAHLVQMDDETLDVRVTDDAGRVLVALRGLAVARAVAAKDERLWFRPSWQPSARRPQPEAAGSTLVLDLDAVAADRLRADHPEMAVTLGVAGPRFKRIASRHFEIDPASTQDYLRLLDAMEEGARPTRILVLWGARGEPFFPTSAPDLTRGFDALLRLSQALLKRRSHTPVSVAYVYPTQADLAPPCLAALGAFARTLRLEDPDVRLQTIGLPADSAGSALIGQHWDAVLAEAGGGADMEVRYGHDGMRRVKLLKEVPSPRRQSSLLRDGGAYIITGGAGGIGLVLAQHLARRGAKLTLIGRSVLTAEKQAALARLSNTGGAVIYERADVGDRAALEEAIQRARSRCGALHGVIHAAGVLGDAFILNKTASQVREVLSAKVDGAIWLDQITRDDQLDFLVFFSSVVSVVGNVGQADYAFANAFLNEFAEAREALRRKGERWGKTLALDWPAWSAGMKGAVDEETERGRTGLTSLSAEEGIEAFEDGLAFEGHQLVVIKGDPTAVRNALAPPVEAVEAELSASGPCVARPTDVEALRPAAEAYLKNLLAEEIRVPAARILATEPLETYGIDSVMVMRLSRRLEADFGALPKTLFFEYQSLRDLVGYFLERHGQRLARKLGVADPADGTAPATVRALPVPASRVVVAEAPVSVAAPVTTYAYDGDIAIVGVSGRYPMADDLETYWKNLVEGRDCITEIPPDRWALNGFFSPEKGKPGKSYSKWGGFLSDVDKFDPLFFNIAPREADILDPQERLFLETVWHLLEDAGYTRESLKGQRTGVFVGVMYGQYQLLAVDEADGRLGMSSYASIANRVSYFFNFNGPSMAVDTMCSSSLTAIHLACESIRRGECDVAVAGGVNVTVHPHKYLQLSFGRFASSDGRCRSFGEGGDGYVPGEGVGAVFLKPLAAAIADGDLIHAVVSGSAINHGGKTNGYTVPNPHAQAAVIAEALRKARVDTANVSYVEAHGTGTALGDPIEIAALARIFGESTQQKGWCPIGSVKSSIGHLESAAGIAALTKVILQMRHDLLAPSLHAATLNSNIDFAATPFYVQREAAEWNRPVRHEAGRAHTLPRIAGVSSFGAGGGNAHLILKEYQAPPSPAIETGPQLVVLSAKTAERLRALAERMAGHFDRRVVSAPHAWRAALQADLLRRACEILNMRDGDIAADDDLRECGLDGVGRTRLGTVIVEAYALEWNGEIPPGIDTVAALAELLASRYGPQLQPRFGASGPDDVWAPPPAPRLADVAFTLQTGREAMNERLALVASDLGEVARCLRLFAAGETPGTGVYAGRAQVGDDEAAVDVFEGKAGQEYLQALIHERRLDRVAQFWVEGARVDWRLLHADGRPRRVILPGYPFARERHWLPVARRTPGPAAADNPNIEAQQEPKETTMVALATESSAPVPGLSGPSHPTLEVRTQLVRDLTSMAASLIGLAPEQMDPKAPFGDYGFESVALTDFADQISSRFGVIVAPTLFFERPSIDGVATWLLEEHQALIQNQHSSAAVVGSVVQPAIVANDQPVPEAATVLDSTVAEPIAVIGMSGRFPGSRNVAEFWENLRDERDLIQEIPADRWDWREYDNDDLPPERRCKFHWGGFIEDVDKFDPLFFGISPAEAEMMDPQQRVFLETVWEAMDDAGYRASMLSGKNVGIFAGVQFSDYQHLLHEAGILSAQSGIGNEHSIVLNRISYLLDLRGPSEPVNTACSSSLVAVHRAVRSLRSGESTIAFAGGIALNLAAHSTVAAGMMGILSSDGKCKTLDGSANGYVKGEGVGVVVLKPLRQALADGDHIHAVIRGTAVNHGGRAASLTAPNAAGQTALVRSAIEEAGVDCGTIGYIELHGTGTKLGDPVEVNALKSAFRQLAQKQGVTPRERPQCGLGSVKTNIGHLEPASGIAGMIKVILAMQHETLPGMLHLKELNQYIDVTHSPFFVVDKTRPWDRLQDQDGRAVPLRAGVSSFGFGGVNAHVLLEEYVPPAPAADDSPVSDQIFAFSAKTDEALQEVIRRFVNRVAGWEANGSVPRAADVAYTLQTGREEFKERLACVAAGVEELRDRLARFLRGEPDGQIYRGQAGSTGGQIVNAGDPRLQAEHWAQGGSVDWTALHRGRRRRVPLPTYPFARKRFWFAAEGTARPRKLAEPAVIEAATSTEQGAEDVAPSGEEYVRAELKQILIEKLKLEEDDLDEDKNLQEFGADSILSAMIMQAAQEKFGSQVPLTAVMNHPTLRSLSRYIYKEFFDGQETAAEPLRRTRTGPAKPSLEPSSSAPASKRVKLPPELLPVNMKGTQQPSFWVHGATGYAIGIQNLSEALGPDYPVYAFQGRGTDGHSMPQTLEDMVEHYVSCIRLVQPNGPYVIGGYSVGGLVAMEIARRLHDEGETIRQLIMFDTYPATQEVFDRHFGPYDEEFLPLYLVNYLLKIGENPELIVHKADIADVPQRLRLAKLARLAKERGKKRISADDIFMYLRGGLLCSEFAEGIYQTYRPKPYDASDVLFFRATDGFTGKATSMYWPPTNILEGYDYVQPWREIVQGNVRLVELGNDHLNMLEAPTLALATEEVESVLRQPPAFDMPQYLRFKEAFDEVTRFGQELLADRFRGIIAHSEDAGSRDAIREKLGVLPRYQRLFDASIDILAREDYARADADGLAPGPKLERPSIAVSESEIAVRAAELASSYPEIKDYLPLLTASQAAVLEVMGGRRNPVDVIFPGGSMKLVAELYKGNLQSDFYNRLLASRVEQHVRRHVRQYRHSKVHLFEVGAGTGAASVFIFETLKEYASRLRYIYTDVGAGFLQVSSAQFAGKHPFIEFMPFDVEQPPEPQGFEPATMDVVIASNVLHTTRRIAVTLEQCRRLLKPGGMLIINELTQRLDYNTLTFGLTTGWWLYEDEDIRIPGSPLLRSRHWERMLKEAGFNSVEILGVPGVEAEDLPQSVIAASRA